MLSTVRKITVQYMDTNCAHIYIKALQFMYMSRKHIQSVIRIWDSCDVINVRVSTSTQGKV